MDKLVKLTRAEMQEVLGGNMAPGCKGNCTVDRDCPDGETCKDDSSELCPSRMRCQG